jgi:phosphoribosyl 1,2-cyclic phosphate phosphodiesterase
MTARLEFTILGCGSSGGVPRADGNWGVCDPDEPKNARTRCSFLVRRLGEGNADGWTTAMVDTAPDLRVQTAAAGVKRVDALLLSHDHADQTHGFDDLRAFFLRHRRRTACYMDEATAEQLTRRFDYIFEAHGGYPAICDALALPPHGRAFEVEGPSGPIPVVGFDQDHGEIRSVGYRFGDVAYSSDVVGLPPEAFAALEGVDTWIVDALRDTPHPTHANVEMALDWIAAVRPRRAILTNLHVDLDYHALRRRLPKGVEPAYDQMRFVREI